MPMAFSATEIHFAKVDKSGKYAWQAEWNGFIADAIEENGQELLDMKFIPKSDITELCTNFHHASDNEKKAFWALFFVAMSKYESRFNPQLRYKERWGGYSEGLLQLSYGDETRHQPCAIKPSEKNIFNPKVNLQCSVSIMIDQISSRHTLFPSKYYYWSVLTDLKKDIKNYFKKYSDQLDFCS